VCVLGAESGAGEQRVVNRLTLYVGRRNQQTDATASTPPGKSANVKTVTIILYKHNNIPREIKHGINAYQ
jgi:hypothetical protein